MGVVYLRSIDLYVYILSEIFQREPINDILLAGSLLLVLRVSLLNTF